MKSFLSIVFSILLAAPQSFANQLCEAALSDLVTEKFEESYFGEHTWAAYCCNSNTYWFTKLLTTFSQPEMVNLIDESQIIFIFDRRLENLWPVGNRGDIPWWRFHVVLETPLGILDLDDKLGPGEKYQPKSRADYFENMFLKDRNREELLEEIQVNTVPARQYLEEFNADHGNETILIESTFLGWVNAYMRQLFPDKLQELEDRVGRLNHAHTHRLLLPKMVGDQMNSLYYMFSREYRAFSKPQSLREFLSP